MLKIKANVKQKEIDLPMGIYLKKQDKWYDTCVVEAMDGDVEEGISEKKLKNNGGKIVTSLLAKKIKQVGDVPFPNGVGEQIARDMFSDDRDTCLIEIRGLMKDDMEINPKCPKCGEEETDLIFMSELIKSCTKWGDNSELHDPGLPLGEIVFELPDGLVVENDETHEETICRKGRLRMPIGSIEENIAQNGLNNAGKANTLLLSACILEIEGLRIVDQYVVKAMSRVDREYLADIIQDAKPGPKFIIERDCRDCDTHFKYMIQLPYFFTSGKSRA